MKTLAEFTANDTIVGDRAAYIAFTEELEAVLCPWGMLEIIFAAEIVRTTWKLQHLTGDETHLDEYSVKYIAKARSGAQTTIRWATTELRRLQTARRVRAEMELPDNIGLAEPREIMKARRTAQDAAPPQPKTANEPKPAPAAKPPKPNPAAEIHAIEAKIAKMLADEESAAMFGLGERTPRDRTNGPCPCGSGRNFAQCCGAESATDDRPGGLKKAA